MDAARYRRIRALLHEAAALDEAARRPFVQSATIDDPALAEEVLALLEDDGIATHAVVPAAVPFAGAAPVLAAGTGLGPLDIVREIGRGGMGVVYEAIERATGRTVAVKVILPALLALPSMRERFAREARLGLAIDHENVVRTLAFGDASVGGRTLHYLTMELVRGRTLRELLTDMGTVPEALWREIAVQAARGLGALHAAGVVHRDLKPENILLTDDRRVRIMDLGVAKVAATGAALTNEGQFIGSMRYASPEQCAGADVGPASDLYGLGVALYELAAGRPPFDEKDPVALLRQQVEATPIPLAERNASYSDFASKVVTTLLEKRPDQRFASAASLETTLEEAESGNWWTIARRGPRRTPALVPSAPSLPLVGRGRERDALLEAWRAARRREGGVVLIHGEGGIGKSRLVEELLHAVRGERAEILRSGFVPAGGGGRLEDAITSRFSSPDLEGEVARRLGVPHPVAQAYVAQVRQEPTPPGHDPIRGDAMDALLARLTHSLSEDAPLVWLVEDLHFADADARKRVVSLARAVTGHRVVLVVTTRPGLASATLSALASLPGFVRLDLTRLDEEGVRALASEAMQDGTLGRRFARELLVRADGIPLFVLAMLRELERSGHLVRDAAGAMKEGRRLQDPHAPSALADLLRARLSNLSAAERRVLDAAAVEGHEFDPGLVAKVLGCPRLEVLETLGRLERVEGLVRSGARLCRFDHHLLQEVTYADLSPALRAEFHARYADVIAAEAPTAASSSETTVRVVRHRLRGPDPVAGASAARAAAAFASQQGRYEEAFDLVARALAATAGSVDRERGALLIEALHLAVTTGRTGETAPFFDEACDIAQALDDQDLLGRVGLERARHAVEQGQFDAALAEIEAVERAHDVAGPDRSRFDVLAIKGLALWSLGRHAEAISVQQQALRVAESLDSPIPLARAASDLAIVLQETGHHGEAELHLRAALATLEQANDRLNVGIVRANLGNVLLGLGRLAEAIPHYETSIRGSRETGQRHNEASSWVNLGFARLYGGELASAREAFLLCERLSLECGARRTGAYATHGLAIVAHWSGDRVEARRRYDEALRVRRQMGAKPGVADTCLSLGTLDIDEGAIEAARAHLTEAQAIADEIGDPSTSVLAGLYRATIGDGDAKAARDAFAEAGSRVNVSYRIEGAWLLWRLSRDSSDLTRARELLEEQARHLPTGTRALFLEHVPYARAVSEGAGSRT